jgi:BioD-like phosphotransacetylase family protein
VLFTGGELMITFTRVMQRIKALLEKDNQQHIYNKDIARALELTPEYFAVIKKRGKIPYEAIAAFCFSHKISLNWILLGQGEQNLCQKRK